MKLRYYLRGIGTGIIIASLIFLISSVFQTPMTDAAIKKRAEKLGMVEKTNGTTISESEKKLAETKDSKESKEKTSTEDKKKSGENNSTEEKNNNDIKGSEENTNTEDKSSSISRSPDNTAYKNSKNSTGIPFSVTSGDTSQSVGKKLYQRGLVDDAGKFSSYMESHNIDEKIMQGNYDIPKNATYSQISDIITGK